MMSKEKRRVPKLRFPGFTEDWEQRKLGGYLIQYTEITTQNNQYPVLTSSRKGLFFQTDYYDGNQIASKDNTGYNIVPYGYFTYRHMSDDEIFHFNINYIVDKGIVSTLYPVFTTKNLNSNFLQLQLNYGNEFKKYAVLLKQGGSRTYMYFNKLKNLNLTISTSIDEQEIIAKFFILFEKLITLHQRKLDNLKLKKKALLQKLFPKNGERYPELRFPGFTDAWEQRKLGSIGSTYTGLSGKTKEDFGHGEAQYITYLNVFQNTISNITMTDKVEIDPTQNEVKYGDVLFTTSSETPEEVGMSSVWLGDTPNIYLNSFCFGFRPNQKIDSYFLGYSLRAPYMRDKIKILAQGISRYNISKNKVMELEISLPKNEEQKLLGTFLQRIDLIITLHQRKLEHLQLQKKALLQQLFI